MTASWAAISSEARALVSMALTMAKSEVDVLSLANPRRCGTPYLNARQACAAALRVAGVSDDEIATLLGLHDEGRVSQLMRLNVAKTIESKLSRLMKGRVQP